MRPSPVALWLATVLGASLGSPAQAQPDRPIGVPIAQGVPGDSNPPDWLSPAGPAYGGDPLGATLNRRGHRHPHPPERVRAG